jgi:tetratricopeptide (TPR) repeat protein
VKKLPQVNVKQAVSQKITLNFIVLCCFYSYLNAQATNPPPVSSGSNITANADYIKDGLKYDLIEKTIFSLHYQKIDSSFTYSSILREKFPEDPVGYFLTANIYQTIMRDYRLNLYEEEFEKYIHRTVEVAEKAVLDNPNAENCFLLGASEGYRCLHWFHEGKWIKAIKSVRKSVKMFNMALEKDPNYIDAIMGLAIYEYGKSKVKIFGIGLFGDKTDKVIADFKQVEESSHYLANHAMYMLQLIYFENEEYEKALEYNQKIFANYPGSSVAWYYRGLINQRLGNLDEAGAAWKELINRVEDFPKPSHGYLIESHYHLADIAYSRENKMPAWQHLRKAAHYIFLYKEEEELESIVYKFDDLKSDVEKAFNEWDWKELSD